MRQVLFATIVMSLLGAPAFAESQTWEQGSITAEDKPYRYFYKLQPDSDFFHIYVTPLSNPIKTVWLEPIRANCFPDQSFGYLAGSFPQSEHESIQDHLWSFCAAHHDLYHSSPYYKEN